MSKLKLTSRVSTYAVLGAALLIGSADSALASTLTQFAFSGVNAGCGCTENVKADFTTMSNGDVQVVLTNLNDTVYDRQVLTGIQFKFDGSGSSAGTVSSQTPAGNTLYNISDATGTLTPTSGSLTAWHTQLDVSPYVTLTNLGGVGAQHGAQGIIGSNTAGPTNNLSNHEPFVDGSATIVIHGLSGTSDSTVITGVSFNFGTALDNYVAGTINLTATPEPGTISMFAIGFLFVGIAGMRRIRAV